MKIEPYEGDWPSDPDVLECDGEACSQYHPGDRLVRGMCSAHYQAAKRAGLIERISLDWSLILPAASAVVRSYDTKVTLRQLFYRLVSHPAIKLPNTQLNYNYLSRKTAEARRAGWFPSLIDLGREIHQDTGWASPKEARAWLKRNYTINRTEGQDYQVWLGVEKRGLVEQLSSWFDELCIPIVALAGFTSETYVDDIVQRVEEDGRPAVMLYGGDLDASGVAIFRDFVKRTDCWEVSERVALNLDQLSTYGLEKLPGKKGNPNNDAFEEEFGELFQVELDALDPNDLRALFTSALDSYWDDDAYQETMAREATERESI